MRLGYINYLNCFPFYYEMLEKSPLPGVEVIPAYPSDLNRMIGEGDLDMSPISSASYADIQEDALIIPGICLSSIGYVRSVILTSRIPIEELDGKRLGLSSASHTSVVLLRILMEKYYGVRPMYLPTSPSPFLEDIDAALVIGNEAMLQPSEPIPYVYDLGDLWLRKTGHPVVFAIFIVRRDAIDRHGDAVERIIASYNRSILCLHTERQKLIDAARRRYPNIAYDIDTYYTLLKFELTYELRTALEFYYNEAGSMGLLRKVKSLAFYDEYGNTP